VAQRQAITSRVGEHSPEAVGALLGEAAGANRYRKNRDASRGCWLCTGHWHEARWLRTRRPADVLTHYVPGPLALPRAAKDESRQRGDPAVGTAQLVGHVLAQILKQRDLEPGFAGRDSLQITRFEDAAADLGVGID